MEFEKSLPGSACKQFPVTEAVIKNPHQELSRLTKTPPADEIKTAFIRLTKHEKERIRNYLNDSSERLSDKYKINLTPAKIEMVAACYTRNIMDIGNAVAKIKSFHDDIKKIELSFYQNHDINIVMENDAIDLLIDMLVTGATDLDAIFARLNSDFEHGLKLVREKTGSSRFFLTRQSLEDPESFISRQLAAQDEYPMNP